MPPSSAAAVPPDAVKAPGPAPESKAMGKGKGKGKGKAPPPPPKSVPPPPPPQYKGSGAAQAASEEPWFSGRRLYWRELPGNVEAPVDSIFRAAFSDCGEDLSA